MLNLALRALIAADTIDINRPDNNGVDRENQFTKLKTDTIGTKEVML